MEKTDISLCRWVSVADSFLVRGGNPCPLPYLGTGTLSGFYTYVCPVLEATVSEVSMHAIPVSERHRFLTHHL